MNINLLQAAEDELIAAVAHYEDIEAGLGLRFKEEARAAMRWIAEHPNVPRLREKGYRRVNLRVFQHYVAYFIREEKIWVLAVAHAHRRPEYRIKRKQLAD